MRFLRIFSLLAFAAAIAPFAQAQTPPDTDSDGIPDSWEISYLGTLAFGASADPGGVSRTLLTSFENEQSPWPDAVVGDGLRLWYRAELGAIKDGSNKVSLLADLSGHGSHVVQADGSLQPVQVPSALNGHSAIQFASTKSLATADDVDLLDDSSDLTVIVAIAPASGQSAAATILSWGQDSTTSLALGVGAATGNTYSLRFESSAATYASPIAAASIGSLQVLSYVKDGTTASSYLDGALQGTDSAPSSIDEIISHVALGNQAAADHPFDGKVAEILVYNRALGSAERTAVESSLLTRYINYDTDSDGLLDSWEMTFFGDLNQSGSGDPDGDGLSNADEFSAGSNPLDRYNGRSLAIVTSSVRSTPSIAYAYDAIGRVVAASYRDGSAAALTFDSASNLTAYTGPGPIAAWRVLYGLVADGSGTGADAATPMSDGIPNLAKYAFGLNPTATELSDQPTVSLVTISGSKYLALTYSRPATAPADLLYRVEVSANGTTWSSGSGAAVDVGTTTASGRTAVTVRDATPIGTPAFGRQIRVVIERIQP